MFVDVLSQLDAFNENWHRYHGLTSCGLCFMLGCLNLFCFVLESWLKIMVSG